MDLVTNECELRSALLRATCRAWAVNVRLDRWLELPAWLPRWTASWHAARGMSWCSTSEAVNRLATGNAIKYARSGFTVMCHSADIVGVSYELVEWRFPLQAQPVIPVTYWIDFVNVPDYFADLLGAEVRA